MQHFYTRTTLKEHYASESSTSLLLKNGSHCDSKLGLISGHKHRFVCTGTYKNLGLNLNIYILNIKNNIHNDIINQFALLNIFTENNKLS
jgi:hypothetical protein